MVIEFLSIYIRIARGALVHTLYFESSLQNLTNPQHVLRGFPW